MGADQLAELFLQNLDLKSFEVGQLDSALLLLDPLAQSDGVEPLGQLEVGDLLSYYQT